MTKAVHKFGGSSLSSAARYQAVANIIIGQCQSGDCIVVSAAGKTTNTLVALWQSYQQQDERAFSDILLQVENHQLQLIDELFNAPQQSSLVAELRDELSSIGRQAQSRQLLEAPLLAFGEIWSARLLAALLNTLNIAAQDVDARTLFTQHQGQLMHSQNRSACHQALDQDKIYVVTGFIAADSAGNTVTLGRNGSDYSATLLANYLDAASVSIWTDTPGVFSTDPRKVGNAIKYSKVCRAQANLLARLGNPVLHAKTLSPLKETAIKLQVRSSFDPDVQGTEVVKQGYSKEKRFVTTFGDLDLLRVDTLVSGEVGALSQLIQHGIHHFNQNGEDYLLVPSEFTHQVVLRLSGRVTIVESHLRGFAVVAPSPDIAPLVRQAQAVLDEQAVVVRFTHSATDYALFLTDQAIDSDVLAILHDKLVNKGRELAVIIAGLGNVGEVFLSQCQQQIARLQSQFDLKVVALLRSQKMVFCPSGLTLSQWQQQWHSEAQDYSHEELLDRISELDYEHKVVIDITASEAFSQLYPDFAAHDCHLISANKYAGTAQHDWYQALRTQLQERNLLWRYNTSVGAGLPVNFALADLQNSGDRVVRIEGVFSGTLSWLCSSFDGTRPFSELVLAAQEMGYTEPDPREDLSGRDMQRKLLILARELGLQLELDDIALEALMPETLAEGSWEAFLARKDELDAFYQQRQEAAQAADKVLRYTGALEIDASGTVRAKVGIAQVAQGSAIANLTPGDNIFVITTQWYEQNPLVIQGPGAGKEVTAAGIHSDLYWLTQQLR
ncbi:bifunctional aspartate kinase/homoserine dehydrogenase II [Pseudoalteromonas ardens]|uniref:Bifunctional aspartokinase/homoserine dehydrogenase n=1 Tax=Pseudoalteromonas rubra TaxID=43658 RepID=A0A0L0EQP8_9GAMM|nr:bifunctional aspartate kinase/homoserine dehydrogenase II [Pseudoalteromonas sp. R96]KNC66721.1 aspartate kinase [Pseudoalteromonas rubra]MDK1314138.1 bifunctional aspartate kinase/homoserine dehydrogenase II [Pseudoalteromonas sp. R96]